MMHMGQHGTVSVKTLSRRVQRFWRWHRLVEVLGFHSEIDGKWRTTVWKSAWWRIPK